MLATKTVMMSVTTMPMTNSGRILKTVDVFSPQKLSRPAEATGPVPSPERFFRRLNRLRLGIDRHGFIPFYIIREPTGAEASTASHKGFSVLVASNMPSDVTPAKFLGSRLTMAMNFFPMKSSGL